MGRPTDSVFVISVTDCEVQSVLNEMENKKSTVHERINFILKEYQWIRSILEALCTLTNMSLVSDYVPDILKVAKILPFYERKKKIFRIIIVLYHCLQHSKTFELYTMPFLMEIIDCINTCRGTRRCDIPAAMCVFRFFYMKGNVFTKRCDFKRDPDHMV